LSWTTQKNNIRSR